MYYIDVTVLQKLQLINMKGRYSKHFKSKIIMIILLKQLVLVKIMITCVAHMGNKLNRCFIGADKIKEKQTKTYFANFPLTRHYQSTIIFIIIKKLKK